MMKVLVLVLSLLFAYTANVFATNKNDRASHDQDQETGIRRRLRSNDRTTNVDCFSNCSRQRHLKMRELLDYGRLSEAGLIGGDFNPENLTKLCNIFDEARTCLDPCPNSQSKRVDSKYLSLGQYLCHDSSLKRNAPCLNEVHKTTITDCESQSKCGPIKTKVLEHERSPSLMRNLTGVFNLGCQLMKCRLDCFKPTVISNCGQSIQNDFQTLVSKTAQALKYAVSELGLNVTVLRKCDRITAVE